MYSLFFDDWHDWWRLFNIITCVGVATMLITKWRKYSNSWNPKTRNFWFVLWTWNLAGAVGSFEGIAQDLEAGTRLVFVTAASVVSIFALEQRGVWGGDET